MIPIVFVIENVCFISWILHRNTDDEEDNADEGEADLETEPETASPAVSDETVPLDLAFTEDVAQPAPENAADPWATVQLDSSVTDAMKTGQAAAVGAAAAAATVAAAKAGDETVMLPKDEIEAFLAGNNGAEESDGT